MEAKLNVCNRVRLRHRDEARTPVKAPRLLVGFLDDDSESVGELINFRARGRRSVVDQCEQDMFAQCDDPNRITEPA